MSIATEESLGSLDLMGQYGNIDHIKIGKPFILKKNKKVRYSAYIQYQNELGAAIAIACLDHFKFEGEMLQCSYSTNKFCSYFRKQEPCRRPECPFVHYLPLSHDFCLEHDFQNDKFFKIQKRYAYSFLETNPNAFFEFLRVSVKPKDSKLPSLKVVFQKTVLGRMAHHYNEKVPKQPQVNMSPHPAPEQKLALQDKAKGAQSQAALQTQQGPQNKKVPLDSQTAPSQESSFSLFGALPGQTWSKQNEDRQNAELFKMLKLYQSESMQAEPSLLNQPPMLKNHSERATQDKLLFDE